MIGIAYYSPNVCTIHAIGSFAGQGLLVDRVEDLLTPLAIALLLLLAVEAVVALVPEVQELNREGVTLCRKGAFSLRFQKASLLYSRMLRWELRQVMRQSPSASWELRSWTPLRCLGGRISRWAVS